MAKNGKNTLSVLAKFSFFATSYLPLFVLLSAKQIYYNIEFLHFGGFNWDSLDLFGTKFGLSVILIVISMIGIGGLLITISNLENVVENGFPVKVNDMRNKNSEAISYIATYIIPFAFVELNNWFDLFSILFLILIIYRIYINSSLILINPILGFKYSLYEIEYLEKQFSKKENLVKEISRTGYVITRDRHLEEDEKIKLYEIGHKMYYSKTISND
jgi:hypothetical protein